MSAHLPSLRLHPFHCAARSCVDTPCKSCKRCLQDFSPFVKNTQTMALTDKDQLAAAFSTFCSSTKRSAGVCESARLALSSSFRGNAARRAGAICVLLSECNTTTVRDCRWVQC